MNCNLQEPRCSTKVFLRIGIVLFALLASRCNPISKPVPQWKSALEHAVAGADRMVIRDTPLFEKSDLAPVEIVDSKLIVQFLNAIEIDEQKTVPNQYCACPGEVQILFKRGEKELAWVAFAHVHSLKWNKGQWHGDAVLTKKSRTAIAGWLKEHARVVISPETTAEDP